MLNFLIAVAGFLLAMLPLVIVHEWGHYWVAKKLGVKILRFSVGFGKPLWMRRFGKDQTEWVLAAIPLGGYVKMLDEAEGEVAEADLPRAFNRQPLWKRVLVVLAGPMANLLLAFVLYSGVLMYGVLQLKPQVMGVTADSAAEKSGFQRNDILRSVNGKTVTSWADADLYFLLEALGQRRTVVGVQTGDGSEQQRVLDFSNYERQNLSPALTRKLGFSIMPHSQEARIGGFMPQGPADKAGIKVDDRILAINGKPVADWDALARTVSASPGQSVSLLVQRGSQTVTLNAVIATRVVDGERVGRMDIGPVVDQKRFKTLFFEQKLDLVDAAAKSWRMGSAMTRLTLEMMGRMVLGQVSAKNISGPIGIATMAGDTLQAGMPIFVTLIVLLSLSLGILNLLPIPVLDGGHLVYYLAEAIRGRPLSDRTLLMGQRLGLVLLGLLTLLAFYNDLHRLLPSH